MTNKYIYLIVVQQHHQGYGWEDVCQSESYREARDDYRAYRKNDPQTPVRMIRRRELNHTSD